MIYTAYYESPLGRLLMSGGGGLTGLWFEGQKYFGAGLSDNAEQRPDLPLFRQTAAWLDDYFGGKNPPADDLPLAPVGSAFRQNVWDILRGIPYGATTTYGGIARRLGGGSARAVGGAVGHNPVSIIIPCHRVVGSDGKMTGYAGGIDRKRQLLALEAKTERKMGI